MPQHTVPAARFPSTCAQMRCGSMRRPRLNKEVCGSITKTWLHRVDVEGRWLLLALLKLKKRTPLCVDVFHTGAVNKLGNWSVLLVHWCFANQLGAYRPLLD